MTRAKAKAETKLLRGRVEIEHTKAHRDELEPDVEAVVAQIDRMLLQRPKANPAACSGQLQHVEAGGSSRAANHATKGNQPFAIGRKSNDVPIDALAQILTELRERKSAPSGHQLLYWRGSKRSEGVRKPEVPDQEPSPAHSGSLRLTVRPSSAGATYQRSRGSATHRPQPSRRPDSAGSQRSAVSARCAASDTVPIATLSPDTARSIPSPLGNAGTRKTWSSVSAAIDIERKFIPTRKKPENRLTARTIAKAARFGRPSLRSKMLTSKVGLPPEAVVAAKDYDERMGMKVDRAWKASAIAAPCPHSYLKELNFQEHLREMVRTRFFIPEKAGVFDLSRQPVKQREEHVVVALTWSVWNYDTIWTPRKKWADSKDYHDTEEVLFECLKEDWKECLDSHDGKTREVIAKNDPLEAPACLDACFEVLWEYHHFVYGVFDYYAALGSSDDVFHIQLNAYKSILEDCRLFEAGSKTLNLTAFDQLFIAINAGATGELARSLNREEWLQCLIRFALVRHVATGRIGNVPDALRHLISHEIAPNVDQRCMQSSHTFREEYCYNQDVVEILTTFQNNLKAIFKGYAKGDGRIGDKLKSANLLGFDQWKTFTKDFSLVEEDFTAREVALTFVWSRMRVIEEENLEGKTKNIQLSFEDFVEAIIRVATLKAFPLDEEIFDYDCEDAGEYILKLRADDPLGYKHFLHKRTPEWGLPPALPKWRLVENTCALIMRTVAAVIASAGDERKSVKDMDNMTPENVTQFMKLCRQPPVKGSNMGG